MKGETEVEKKEEGCKERWGLKGKRELKCKKKARE
jgi:hypothetical protein